MRIKNFREKAHKDLDDIARILGWYQIKYFLLSGAMLGAVREGDFIEHDWDLDLGATKYPRAANQIKIVGQLEALGFKWDFQQSKKSGRLVLDRNIHTDLHFFEKEKDRMICKIYEKPLLTFPSKFMKLSKAKLGKRRVNILDKGYLDWMYKDWKTPMKTNYFKDGYKYVS